MLAILTIVKSAGMTQRPNFSFPSQHFVSLKEMHLVSVTRSVLDIFSSIHRASHCDFILHRDRLSVTSSNFMYEASRWPEDTFYGPNVIKRKLTYKTRALGRSAIKAFGLLCTFKKMIWIHTRYIMKSSFACFIPLHQVL